MASKQQDPLFLQGLNEQQRLAVEHGDEPLLIVAGAGTGKTKTLVHRVAQLIARGIPQRALAELADIQQADLSRVFSGARPAFAALASDGRAG